MPLLSSSSPQTAHHKWHTVPGPADCLGDRMRPSDGMVRIPFTFPQTSYWPSCSMLHDTSVLPPWWCADLAGTPLRTLSRGSQSHRSTERIQRIQYVRSLLRFLASRGSTGQAPYMYFARHWNLPSATTTAVWLRPSEIRLFD